MEDAHVGRRAHSPRDRHRRRRRARARSSSISTRAEASRASSTRGSPAYGFSQHLSVDSEADAAAIEANRRTYGVAWPSLSFKDAKLIVSFGADFLDGWGASVPQQLDFADARAKLDGAPRFIYIGPRRSLTGLNADEWIACKPGSELSIANALAGKGSVAQAATDSGVPAAALQRLVDRARGGKAGARRLRRERRQRARRRARRCGDQSGARAPSARRSSPRSRSSASKASRRRARCSTPSSAWRAARSASRSCAERTPPTRCPSRPSSPSRLAKSHSRFRSRRSPTRRRSFAT